MIIEKDELLGKKGHCQDEAASPALWQRDHEDKYVRDYWKYVGGEMEVGGLPVHVFPSTMRQTGNVVLLRSAPPTHLRTRSAYVAGDGPTYPRKLASDVAATSEMGRRLRLQREKGEDIAKSTEDVFETRSATYTEMVRSLVGSRASSTVEDIRRVVQNCQGQDGKRRYRVFPKGTHQEVKDAAVEEDASRPAVCLPCIVDHRQR